MSRGAVGKSAARGAGRGVSREALQGSPPLCALCAQVGPPPRLLVPRRQVEELTARKGAMEESALARLADLHEAAEEALAYVCLFWGSNPELDWSA